ncbi:MAG: type I restriction enzyme HsdR N-terminal domain-containing protein [Myxococcales bacterium]|nr:type I restriction enzyme HsdR N-terminal domain-containing protein [Myxococcales bacterium]
MHLKRDLGVPDWAVTLEHCMTHFKRDARGRADIVVWSPEDEPLFVVECKAPGVALTDDVLDQALRYHDLVEPEAGVIGLTNGDTTAWYAVEASGGRLARLEHAPRYADLVAGRLPPEVEQEPAAPRPHHLAPTSKDYAILEELGVLGEGSPREHHGYLSNLAGLLYFEDDPDYSGRSGRFSVESTGLRYASFGNAAGGRWPGLYRYFVICDERGDAQVISFAVLGKLLAKNHPKFGNTSGTTMLIVAVDDFDQRHNSLQLDLDKFVTTSGEAMTLWHDGTLTRGKRGRMKNAVVMSWLRSRAPHLVSGSSVMLGSLPVSRPTTWADAETFIYNCIDYALVRDALRREP